MAEENKHGESEFQFVQEKIKQPAPRKAKLLRRTALSVLFGAIFGVVACITFVVLYPWAQERFGEELVKEVNIPRDEEPAEEADEEQKEPSSPSQEQMGNAAEKEVHTEQESNHADVQQPTDTEQPVDVQQPSDVQQETDNQQPEDPLKQSDSQQEADPVQQPEVSDEEPIEITQIVELELEDYTKLYEKMRSVGKEAARSMVTVTAEKSGTDWFNALQENERQVSGMIVGENGVEMLILTNYGDIEGAGQLHVTFSDYTGAPAVLKKYDRITNLAVLGVNLADMTDTTRNQVKIVNWGNSKTVKAGEPVIAVGNPVGVSGSMLYGNISALTYDEPVVDGKYQLLLTDMISGAYSNGALVNFEGETIGWIQNSYLHLGNTGTLTAYGISSLKRIIEHLCNNQDIAYLGVTGMEMDAQMQKILSFPTGVYIASVEMDSPAMSAGMQSGDIIVDISGQRIGKVTEMQEVLLNFSAEQNINIKVLRQGKEGLKEISFDVALTSLK